MKTLRDLTELGVIEYIRARAGAWPPEVEQGIGDDAAVVKTPGGLLLITTDLLVEGVHFSRDFYSPRDLGYKALAVNLSDIAAMGGVPRYLFCAAGFPGNLPAVFLEEMVGGFEELMAEFQVALLGGDVTGSKEGIVICITVVGEMGEARPIYRRGAQAGDDLYVTGPLGLSAAGLMILKAGAGCATTPALWQEPLVKAHLRPRPRIAEGQWLAAQLPRVAGLDLSDGLAQDLPRLCQASGVGAKVRADRLPVAPLLQDYCRQIGREPLDFILCGGEDYELLFAAPPEFADQLKSQFMGIGKITPSAEGIILVGNDGKEKPFPAGGFDHFAG